MIVNVSLACKEQLDKVSNLVTGHRQIIIKIDTQQQKEHTNRFMIYWLKTQYLSNKVSGLVDICTIVMSICYTDRNKVTANKICYFLDFWLRQSEAAAHQIMISGRWSLNFPHISHHSSADQSEMTAPSSVNQRPAPVRQSCEAGLREAAEVAARISRLASSVTTRLSLSWAPRSLAAAAKL